MEDYQKHRLILSRDRVVFGSGYLMIFLKLIKKLGKQGSLVGTKSRLRIEELFCP